MECIISPRATPGTIDSCRLAIIASGARGKVAAVAREAAKKVVRLRIVRGLLGENALRVYV